MHAERYNKVILQLSNLSWQLCIVEKRQQIKLIIALFLYMECNPHYSDLLVIIFKEISQYIFLVYLLEGQK